MIVGVNDDYLLVLDEKGNIESCDRKSEKIMGYHPTELPGKNFKIFYSKEDRDKGLPQNLISNATENGTASYEGWNINKDGKKVWSGAYCAVQ